MATFETQHTKKPPTSSIGVIAWLRDNLFSTPLNSGLTLLALYLLYLMIPPLSRWMFFDADFVSMSNQQCTREGACWSYVIQKMNLYLYGFYPASEYWRIQIMLAFTLSFPLITPRLKPHQHRSKIIIAMLVCYPIIAFFLLYGGWGLSVVETYQWGGLMLTVVVAMIGIIVSLPIGILLALGRQSKMQIIKFFSIIYIEFIRGVPLITILFMASVVLPLFFTEGINFDKLLRVLIGITLFQSAYIAEVVRGGLEAIPKGQHEAADAMGFNFTQKTVFIILPQALKISIPNIVGSFIALFKDTTLVLIIGLFDMLAIVGLSSSDENWLGRETEGYVFVTIVMWSILYSMSLYSKKLERQFNTEYK